MSLLMEIQADAQRVANAIAAALELEVTISDTDFRLVVSSSGYYASKGATLYSPFKRPYSSQAKPLLWKTQERTRCVTAATGRIIARKKH